MQLQETEVNRLLTLVACMAVLTWLLLMLASLIRVKGWTLPGILRAFGNRDHLPEPTAFAGRADRTARNTLEAMVLFTAVAFVVHASGTTNPLALTGAEVFFWARLAYIPVYYLGIPFLRTTVWTVGIGGLGTMLVAAWSP